MEFASAQMEFAGSQMECAGSQSSSARRRPGCAAAQDAIQVLQNGSEQAQNMGATSSLSFVRPRSTSRRWRMESLRKSQRGALARVPLNTNP